MERWIFAEYYSDMFCSVMLLLSSFFCCCHCCCRNFGVFVLVFNFSIFFSSVCVCECITHAPLSKWAQCSRKYACCCILLLCRVFFSSNNLFSSIWTKWVEIQCVCVLVLFFGLVLHVQLFAIRLNKYTLLTDVPNVMRSARFLLSF